MKETGKEKNRKTKWKNIERDVWNMGTKNTGSTTSQTESRGTPAHLLNKSLF